MTTGKVCKVNSTLMPEYLRFRCTPILSPALQVFRILWFGNAQADDFMYYYPVERERRNEENMKKFAGEKGKERRYANRVDRLEFTQRI